MPGLETERLTLREFRAEDFDPHPASIKVALRLGATREGSALVPPRVMDICRHNMDF